MAGRKVTALITIALLTFSPLNLGNIARAEEGEALLTSLPLKPK